MICDVKITAYSSVSAAGTGRDSLFEAYKNQKDLATSITLNNKNYPVFKLNNQAREFIEALVLRNKELNKLDPTVLYAIVCLEDMLKQTNLPAGKGLICIGTSRGNCTTYEKFLSEFIQSKGYRTNVLTSPLTTLGNISSEVASYLSQYLLNDTVVVDTAQTCTSTGQAIMNSIAWLEAGFVDWAIAGGSEAPITPFTIAQVEALGIYSKITGEFPCRPLEKNATNNTFVLGEGAALFLIQKNSLTNSLATIKSFSSLHLKPPTKTGIDTNGGPLFNTINAIYKDIKAIPDVIITHSPGTLKGDKAEYNAIKSIFKDMPFCLPSKYFLGHTYGASMALNIALAIEILKNQALFKVPYDMFLEQNYPHEIKSILINSTGFGGVATSIVLTK